MVYSNYKLVVLLVATLQLYHVVEDSHTWINEHKKIDLYLDGSAVKNDYLYDISTRYSKVANVCYTLMTRFAMILTVDILYYT